MSKLVDVTAENDLEEGTMKAVTVDGQEVLLARTSDGFHAINNICPHMKGSLSEGVLEGFIVTCPRHGSQFDVRNGEVIRWLKGSGMGSRVAKLIKPPRATESYRVEIKDGRISVEIG